LPDLLDFNRVYIVFDRKGYRLKCMCRSQYSELLQSTSQLASPEYPFTATRGMNPAGTVAPSSIMVKQARLQRFIDILNAA